MKKIIVLILTFAYLASVSGATVYIHQCMGKTIAWDIIENEGNNCTKCGMHKNAPNDCCKDHVKILKVQNDQSLPKINFENFLPYVSLIKEYNSFITPVSVSIDKGLPQNYTLFRSDTDYCIMYCTFLV